MPAPVRLTPPSRSRRALAGSVTAAALVVVGGVAAGCTPDGSTPPTPTPTATRTAQPIQLTVAVYGPPEVISAYTAIASDFSTKHPGTTISIRPFTSHDALMADLQQTRGTDREPDLFLASSDDVPELIASKTNQRVDEMMTSRNLDLGDDYQRQALEAFSADTALQCMPVSASPLVVYYNPSLVQFARLRPAGENVPNPDDGWRLSDFVTAARQASTAKTKGVYVAPDVTQVAPFLFSGGGELVDDQEKPTTSTFVDDASSMQKLLDLVRDRSVTYSKAQLTRRDALTRFRAGKLAMILGFRDLTPTLRNQQGLRFGVMPMPRVGRSATVLDVAGMCVRAKTDHRTTAGDFLAYLVGDEASRTLAATGYVVPVNAKVLYSDDFTQPTLDPAGSQVFATQIRYGRTLPRGDRWRTAEERIDADFDDLFYGTLPDSLEDRLQALDGQVSQDLSGQDAPSDSPSASPSGSGSATPTP